jgi:carboxymethylenebutenolidase
MTVNDLGDMQRYLVEEEAEKWREGRLSRREFIRRVTLLVGGAAAASGVLMSLGCDATTPESTPTAAATTAAGEAPSPTAPTEATAGAASPSTPTQPAAAGGNQSPYHVAEDNPALRTETVDIPTSDPSVQLKGYLALNQVAMGAGGGPGAGPARPGGVLVVHENRGLTEHIKDVVRRIAIAGYVGLGVDLLSRAGGTDAHPDEGARTGILGQTAQDVLLGDLMAGVEYLKSREDVNPGRIGAIGFCFGGGMVWRLATKQGDLKAAVPFYGPNPPLEDVLNIKAAVLGIYGSLDSRITGGVPELEEALKNAGVTYEIKIYDGAEHAFHNDTGPRYNPEAAKDVWEKTLAWLATRM